MNAHFGPSNEFGMRWTSAGREDCPRSSTRSGHAISEVAASLVVPDESVVLCGQTRPNRVRGPRICGLVRKDEASGTKARICGLVRKDEAGLLTRAPASVALCGKTRPYWAGKPSICGLVRKDGARSRREPPSTRPQRRQIQPQATVRMILPMLSPDSR